MRLLVGGDSAAESSGCVWKASRIMGSGVKCRTGRPQMPASCELGLWYAVRVVSSPKIGLAYGLVLQQRITGVGQDDATVLQHIAPIGQLQRPMGVLLYQKNGHAF